MTTNSAIPVGDRGPAAPIVSLLHQLADVVARLDEGKYRLRRSSGVSGSIGSHVRHCLDHIAALVRGARTGELDYDSRSRGTAVETHRDAARAEIRRLALALGDLTADVLRTRVTFAALVDEQGSTLTVDSTVGRELAFVLSHTIHHFAVIALLLQELGVSVPPGFGYAPATLVAGQAARCA